MAREKKSKQFVSRRSFLKTAGLSLAATGLTAGGLTGLENAIATEMPEKWDTEADVVVLGFGAAGASAAEVAHDAGAKVLILEKMPMGGGNTSLCGGAVYGAGTSVQKALGIEDSGKEMKKYYELIKPGLNRPEFIDIISEQSGEAVEWMIRNGASIPAQKGMPGLTMGGFEKLHQDVTPARERSHWIEGGGKGMFDVFKGVVESRKIPVEYRTAVKKLIMDPETLEIAGVLAERKGNAYKVKANQAVIIATGGYSRSKELLTAYAPGGNAYKGAKGSLAATGDGVIMGQAVGGSLWAMHEILESMGILKAPGAFFTPFMEFTVIVNTKGERYIREDAWTEPISEATLKQPDASAFLVFDADLRKRSEVDTTLKTVIPAKYVEKADTLAALAEKLNIPIKEFEATIAKFNEGCATGKDAQGKNPKDLFPVKTSPFYGIKSVPLPVVTTGGLLTDTEARVLNPFDEPIKRLYAAGETTGGKLVGYPGCGTSITSCIIFGHIAGKNAAAESSRS